MKKKKEKKKKVKLIMLLIPELFFWIKKKIFNVGLLILRHMTTINNITYITKVLLELSLESLLIVLAQKLLLSSHTRRGLILELCLKVQFHALIVNYFNIVLGVSKMALATLSSSCSNAILILATLLSSR